MINGVYMCVCVRERGREKERTCVKESEKLRVHMWALCGTWWGVCVCVGIVQNVYVAHMTLCELWHVYTWFVRVCEVHVVWKVPVYSTLWFVWGMYAEYTCECVALRCDVCWQDWRISHYLNSVQDLLLPGLDFIISALWHNQSPSKYYHLTCLPNEEIEVGPGKWPGHSPMSHW